MDKEGNILFFDPFYFKNGNKAKPKYFIILKVTDNKSLLASLPSSIDYRPSHIIASNGCVEIPEASFNCYIFKARHVVTTNTWSFPLDTYVYGQQIDEYEISNLKDIYPVEGLDYKIIGSLLTDEFRKLIDCFKSSANVKRKFKRLLQ